MCNENRTLGVGLGAVYVGERLGDYFSPLVLPSYTRWDAGLFYRYNRMNLNLFVENIFDERYYTSSISQFEVFPGAPINVKGQFTWTF
jgi:iron complex outermembrane receptor protein